MSLCCLKGASDAGCRVNALTLGLPTCCLRESVVFFAAVPVSLSSEGGGAGDFSCSGFTPEVSARNPRAAATEVGASDVIVSAPACPQTAVQGEASRGPRAS